MKKRLLAIVAVFVALTMCFGLVSACAPDDPGPEPEPTTYTVTRSPNPIRTPSLLTPTAAR